LPATAREASAHQGVFTEWDSEHDGASVSLRSLHRDNWTITAYNKSSLYEGHEGELYDLGNDPRQWRNLWDDPNAAAMKRDLLDDLRARTPVMIEKRPVAASV
jgi:hypothetical protein